MLTLSTERAYAQMVDAHTAGLQICVHAIGDRATRTAAELFAQLLREHPGGHRHRIEHASMLEPTTIDLLAELGLAAVVQPISLESERAWLGKRLGDERVAHVYPFRSLLDAGVTVAGSSDAPIESVDVLTAMACAVDRRGIGLTEAITPLAALALYTRHAAHARHVEGQLGTIAPGARADLAVLSTDPRDDLHGAQVLATIVSGRDLYRAERL
jgi:predicted amidohydrolase YtcJ